MGTPYEQISAAEYWEQNILPVPELGRVAMWGDERSARSTSKQAEIEGAFMSLRELRGQVRTLMVEEGEDLPAPEDFGLVRVVLDERRRREGGLGSRYAPLPDGFNEQAAAMLYRPWYLGTSIRTTVPGADDDHYFEVTRSLVYARPARSGRQLVGISSEVMCLPPSGPNMLLPRFTVGPTYRDETKGVQRDRRVVQAHVVTPLIRAQNDRPTDGEQNPARGWSPFRQFSLGNGIA